MVDLAVRHSHSCLAGGGVRLPAHQHRKGRPYAAVDRLQRFRRSVHGRLFLLFGLVFSLILPFSTYFIVISTIFIRFLKTKNGTLLV